MAEKIVKLSTDDQNLRRSMLSHNVVCDLRDKSLPIWGWYGRFVGNLLTNHL